MDPLTLGQLPSLDALNNAGQAGSTQSQGASEAPKFSDILQQALKEVNEASSTSDQEARNLISGNSTDMHTAILAVQKADVSFQMMMAVRSKLVSAYQEVMRMQM